MDPNVSEQDVPKADGLQRMRRLLPLIAVVALLLLAFSLGWHKYLTLDQLITHRETLRDAVADNYALATLIFAGVYIAVIILSLPGGALATIAGGFLFGWLMGGLTVLVAATIGATLLFLIARSAIGEYITGRVGPWLDKLAKGFQADAFSYLLFLRLVPIFPFWLVNLAPAMLDVPLRTFILATAIGIIPGTFAFAFLGSGLDSVIEAQRMANPACTGGANCEINLQLSNLVTPQLLGALAALGVVALIPLLLKRWRLAKNHADQN